MQGHHLMELGLDFFYPLCRPIPSQNLLPIKEDVEGYYQQFYDLLSVARDPTRSDPLSPRFMLNRKANFLR